MDRGFDTTTVIGIHRRHASRGIRCRQRFCSGIFGYNWFLLLLLVGSSLGLYCLPGTQALGSRIAPPLVQPHPNTAETTTPTRTRTTSTQTFARGNNTPNAPCAAAARGGNSLTTTISENVWRKAASDHRTAIRELLEPGLVDLDHPMMRPVRKYYDTDDGDSNAMTMLDPKHPIYNFLVEYYGLKGLKGPKRLARWSPGIGLFFWDNDGDGFGSSSQLAPGKSRVRRIDSLEDYHATSNAYRDSGITEPNPTGRDETDRGIFLEGATFDDFALTLYLQGAEWIDRDSINEGGVGRGGDDLIYGGKSGILYRPIRFYDLPHEAEAAADPANTNEEETQQQQQHESQKAIHKKATSFLWYKSILQKTLDNEAVLHCYGLHEWAMQYHPDGAPPPPSGKYQAHLPLRVSRTVINSTVERKGLRCTHVDALRFFAPAAGPLNLHGAVLERQDQLELEQPGCVHAHMDLLKIALRIKPYCDPSLLLEILGVALRARALDVGASPYDCSAYSGGTSSNNSDDENTNAKTNAIPITIIPIETPEGRSTYRTLQSKLMDEAECVRTNLLANYEAFGALTFCADQLEQAMSGPSDERFAKAEPGGKAWRQNLIDRSNDRNLPPQTAKAEAVESGMIS